MSDQKQSSDLVSIKAIQTNHSVFKTLKPHFNGVVRKDDKETPNLFEEPK